MNYQKQIEVLLDMDRQALINIEDTQTVYYLTCETNETILEQYLVRYQNCKQIFSKSGFSGIYINIWYNR
jgi:hypothetical protein